MKLLKYPDTNETQLNLLFIYILQNQCFLFYSMVYNFFILNATTLKFIYLFIYLWLRWVFVSVRGLSLVVASGGHSSSRCAGLSLSRPLLLQSTGSRRAGSVIVAHGPSCSAACGILPDQGTNPCPLHWQADSQPLHHQGSPITFYYHYIVVPCLITGSPFKLAFVFFDLSPYSLSISLLSATSRCPRLMFY